MIKAIDYCLDYRAKHITETGKLPTEIALNDGMINELAKEFDFISAKDQNSNMILGMKIIRQKFLNFRKRS